MPRSAESPIFAGLKEPVFSVSMRRDSAGQAQFMNARKHVLTALLCAVFTLNSLAAEPEKAASDRTKKLTDADAVFAPFLRGEQTVRVLVRLNDPQERNNVNFDDRNSVAALHAAVRRKQDAVLNKHAARDLKLRRRYENHAGFSAEVSWDSLQRLMVDPDVLSIEPVTPMKPHLGQGIPLINGMTYRSTFNGDGVSVAICDTGVDYRHPRLGGGTFPNAKVIGGFDVGDNDANPIPEGDEAHGTACAGIAAGSLGTVGDYIGGVAPNSKIYALKITPGASGFSTDEDIAAAWDWCVTHKNDNINFPILVISTSFGGGQYFSACDAFSSTLAASANSAVAAGITLFVSSGNDGYCNSISSPACISGVIAVGAVYDANFGPYFPCISAASCVTRFFDPGCSSLYYTIDSTAPDRVTSYANMSQLVGVLAPANQCYTTDIIGTPGYDFSDYLPDFGGTSAACPYSAGAAAALQSAARTRLGRFLTPAEVRSKLTGTGDNILDIKANITKPRVNLGRAIDSLVSTQLFTITATLSAENCTPTNRAIDPGEAVNMNVTLRNTGNLNATNVTATLLATGGTLAPSGPQNFGILNANGAGATRSFSFTAGGVCEGIMTNTLSVQVNGSNWGTLSLTYQLGGRATRLNQSFDGVKAPALPAGWVSTGSGNVWVTTTNRNASGTNSVFISDPATTTDVSLLSPAFAVTSTNAQLSFTHDYNTEYGFDGGVLEIAINGGSFIDFVTAGGYFVTNGYDFPLDLGFGSPIAGRSAWTGDSEGFVTTLAVLPPAALNTTVQLRWRFATDGNVAAEGWYLDNISVGEYACCRPPAPVILNPRRVADKFAFSYSSKLGITYAVDYKDSMTNAWTPLTLDNGNGNLRNVTNNLTGGQRFFRLREL
jgi:subtilisin family serine protease